MLITRARRLSCHDSQFSGYRAGIESMRSTVPKPIGARLNTEINNALASTPVKEKLTGFGYELVGGSSEQFEAFFRKENVKWSDVVRRSGARID